MRTDRSAYFSATTHASSAAHATAERGVDAEGGAATSIEAYRSRVAAKVDHFLEAYWSMHEARDRQSP